MAIYYPTRKEIYDRMITDMQIALGQPISLENASMINSFIVTYSGRIYELYQQLQAWNIQGMPDTAQGDYAIRWGSLKNIKPLPALASQGHITATGIATSVIPINTILQSSSGIQYLTQTAATITSQAITITSLTRSGSLATATTSGVHHYASGMTVTISGANQIEYNGIQTITVTGDNTFTYSVIGTPTTPATGTIISTKSMADLIIKSITFGKETNADNGEQLTFQSLISGVDQTAFVQYGGLIGGADKETDEDYRQRYIYAYQNTPSQFSPAYIYSYLQGLYPDLTRCWIFTPNNSALTAGLTSIYFTVDGRPNPIPTINDINNVKTLVNAITPCGTPFINVSVNAPTPITVNFVFTALSPNTNTMQAAIVQNLQALFRETPNVGVNLSANAYISAIWQTVDPSNGNTVQSFALSNPSGDITISTGQLAILGTVTF
jgi:uncharacterized phage protein gp47/JayE